MTGREARIQEILVKRGRELFDAERALVRFTDLPEADALLNDIENTPHAFVLACVMDKQIKAERAWLIPYRLSEKLGAFEFSVLQGLAPERVENLMTLPEPLHRFPTKMATEFHQAIRLLDERYGGNASLIWANNPSSATVVYRFLQFQGVGPKIATMAANILARDFKVPLSDYYSIDVSADIHVKRVFRRLGLVERGATNEQVIYRARALHPGFPGLLDLPTWDIGREWCRPQHTDCPACIMRSVCPSATM